MLVDQLLLLARFENQKQNIVPESIYLNALILDILTLYSDKINAKKLHIKFKAEEDYYIHSDTYLIMIILRNIISNAINYTNAEGDITILLSKENNKTICLIKDNGIGIDQEDLETVFNPFYRSRSSEHPEIKGTGLGLSIVKRISELLHVKFKITSEIGEGTTVVLNFGENMKTL
ncbi:ATP-binding protein [Flavobacterium sp. N1736]|uniref:sensor histidine kinase n=1 Tax=Flavobacterium sp. N1736 TaxID=2986823 RepID=UPI0029CAB28E|nr:ATP-binding protein [Flavobacterium sp. N1736]